MYKNKLSLLVVGGLALLSLAGCQAKTVNVASSGAVIADKTQSVADKTDIEIAKNIAKASPKAINFAHNPGMKSYTEQDVADLKGKTPLALLFDDGQSISKNMTQQIEKNLPLLPSDIILMKLDFKRTTDLRKQYNINNGAIWLILDKNGKEVARNAGIDFDSLVLDLIKAV